MILSHLKDIKAEIEQMSINTIKLPFKGPFRDNYAGRSPERISCLYSFRLVLLLWLSIVSIYRKKSNRRFQIFSNPEETSFSIFPPGHFEQVGLNWELNETTNETYRTLTSASPGRPQKVSMIYLLRFRRYMRPNK